jgi:hypothetical protein
MTTADYARLADEIFAKLEAERVEQLSAGKPPRASA